MNIQEALSNIMKAVLGKDVRQSIHDGIEQCYKDATGHPDSVAAVVKENQDMMDLLEKTPYTTMEEEDEMVLPVHTINDDTCDTTSTWSSKKMSDTFPLIKDDSIGNKVTWSSNKIKSEIPVIPTIQMALPRYTIGFESYSDDQKPMFYYLRFDNFYLVHFVGAIRKTALLMTRNYAYTNKIPMATTPTYLKPLTNIQILCQASQDKKYLLNMDTDGTISASRYGDMFDDNGVQSQTIPDNSWLTVNAFYITNV